MTDLIKAAQQALEAMERFTILDVCQASHHTKKDQHGVLSDCPVAARFVATVEALRSALAAAPQAEPVAWLVTTETQAGKRLTSALTGRYKDVRDACDFGEPVPLYTHPAPTTDVVRDAGRYRFIRDADRSGCIGHEISLYAMESLDEYVDAAMQGDAAMKGADHE